MNDNIDIRMSNYIAIIGNPQMRMGFDSKVIHAMEKSVAIYAATTSKAYLEEYDREQKRQEVQDKFEDVSRMMR